MSWLDYAVAGLVLASVAWGAWRGLVREIFAILGWIIAFLAANLLAGPLGERLPEAITGAPLRVAVAFAIVFFAALLASGLIGLLLSKLVRAAGLGGLDRMSGAAFGIARGLLLLLALAIVAGLTEAPRERWWRESLSGPALTRAALAFAPWLPATLAGRLRYD